MGMWKRYLVVGLGFLMILFSRTAVGADVVLLEDNFDTENDAKGAGNYSGFKNWIVTRGTVDLIGNGLFDFYPNRGLYVDLDGSTSLGGKLASKTSFMLNPGTYELQFDMGNNGQYANTVTVTLGNVYSKSFTQSNLPSYQTILETITVSKPTRGRLVFDQSGGDNQGIIIDNIRLTHLSNP